MLSAVLPTSVVAVTFKSVQLVGVDRVSAESVALTIVGTSVLFAVLVAVVAGAHATSRPMQSVTTRLKIFFRFISFLHLYTVPLQPEIKILAGKIISKFADYLE
jgi:hypothetical protein